MKLKTLLAVFAVAFSVFILTGCAEHPSEVVAQYAAALLEGDVERANSVSAPELLPVNAKLVTVLKQDSPVVKQIRQNLSAKFNREEIDGDLAFVWSEGNESNLITLKKIDGKWKVTLERPGK